MSSLRSKKNLFLCLNTIIIVGLLQFSVLAEERQGLLINSGLSIINDSNITRTAEEVSDQYAIFSPQLQFLSRVGQHHFIFDYQGDFAAYKDNTQYNFNNHDLKFSALFDHSVRVNSEFTFGYQDKAEEPGSTSAAGTLNNEFNQLTSKFVLAELFYGTSASSGQLVFGLAHDQTRYTNNEQGFRDMDKTNFSSTFFYRMAPNTRLLLEASIGTNEYAQETQFADQSSDQTLYLAGVEWDATAATTGTFKLGYQSRSYDDERLTNLSGLSYLVDMSWRPNTFSKLTIGASRLTNESAQQDIGGSINTGYSFTLEQDFTPRTSLNLLYQQDKSDFSRAQVSSAQNRTDKRKRFEVGLAHSVKPWLDISLDYRHETRNSGEALFEFSLNTLELGITTNFK